MLCFGRRGFAAVALAVIVCVGGCATFQGARLYRRGSIALERGEVERAVADLERAAPALLGGGSALQRGRRGAPRAR